MNYMGIRQTQLLARKLVYCKNMNIDIENTIKTVHYT